MKNFSNVFVFILAFFQQSQAQLWEQVGGPEARAFATMFADSVTNTLYAEGILHLPGDTTRGIVRLVNGNWEPILDIDHYYSGRITRYNDYIVVGAKFSLDSFPLPTNIAKWDGSEWTKISNTGEGFLPGGVEVVYTHNGILYAGGTLGRVDSVWAYGIAQWDGEKWSDMNMEQFNHNAEVTDIQLYNGDLFAGGNFKLLDAPSPQFSGNYNVARWDGEIWHPLEYGLGDGISGDGPVTALAEFKDELYIAGTFPSLGIAYTLVKWNGEAFVPLGAEEPSYVHDMVVYNGELYMYGMFDSTSEIGHTEFFKWDGTKWCSLGSIFNGTVSDLEVFNGELYASGFFFDINGEPYHSVVKWVGGDYVAQCGTPVSAVRQAGSRGADLALSPNPATASIFISVENVPAPATLSAHNLLGQFMLQRALLPAGGDIHETVDVSTWPPGVYFFTLRAGGQVWSEKAVIRE